MAGTEELDLRDIVIDDAGRSRGRGKGKAKAKSKNRRSASTPGGEGAGPTLWRLIKFVVRMGLVVVIVGIAALAGLFFYYSNDPNLPSIGKLADYRPPQITRVLDRHGVVVGEIGKERRTMVSISKIPKHLIDAVVAAEDPEFFRHQGVDYRGILRAIVRFVPGWLSGGTTPGGSTITQQVVKQLVLSPEKALRRKIQEIILARQLSQRLSKQEILEIYLNHNNYGAGHYGCEEGAKYYFGKSVTDINLAEAAVLAGVPQIPSKLDPRRHPTAAKNRQCYVLRRMVEQQMLDRAQAETLCDAPIVLAREPPPRANLAPEVVGSVHGRLLETWGAAKLDTLGLTVKTTIDMYLQGLARESLERGLESLDVRQGFRGPSQRLSGKALDKHRAELHATHKMGLSDSAIVEGIVERIEKNATDPRQGRLYVDVGSAVGVVDLIEESRYTAGPTPLLDRFKPGDLVRVRAAPDRAQREDRPSSKQPPLALELGPQAAMVVMDPQTREVLALVGGYDFHPGGFDRARRAERQAGSAFKPFVYAAAIDSKKYTAASIVNDAPEVYDLWKPQNYEKEQFRGPVRLRTALADSINTVAIKLCADVGLPMVREMAGRAGLYSPMPDDLGLAMALGAGTVTPLELANAYATFAAAGRRGEPRLILDIGEPAAATPTTEASIRPETAYVVLSLMRSVVEDGTAKAAGARLKRPIAGKTGTSSGYKDAWFVGFTPDLLAAVWVGFDDNKKLGRGEAGAKAALPIWIDFMAKALTDRPAKDFPQPPGVTIMRIDPATGLLAPPGGRGIDEVFVAGTAPTEVAPSPGEDRSEDRLLLE